VAKIEMEARDAAIGRAGWDKDLTQWMVFKVFDIVYIEGQGAAKILRDTFKVSVLLILRDKVWIAVRIRVTRNCHNDDNDKRFLYAI
jgi:hypothetical protein